MNSRTKIKRKNPSPEQTFFTETALEIISPIAEKFGFIIYRAEIKQYSATIIYLKDKQYIKIDSSTYPRDYPYCYNIILGEGNCDDFYQYDWNSIALWRMKSKIDPNTEPKQYEFPKEDNVKNSINNAGLELLQYADNFLKGDLTLFYEIRSEQNKAREPYKIHTHDNDGNYVTTYDQRCIEEKERNS